MQGLINDLVLEARREGLRMADIRYESELWNEEKDLVYCRFYDSGGDFKTIEKEV